MDTEEWTGHGQGKGVSRWKKGLGVIMMGGGMETRRESASRS